MDFHQHSHFDLQMHKHHFTWIDPWFLPGYILIYTGHPLVYKMDNRNKRAASPGESASLPRVKISLDRLCSGEA